MSTGPSNGPPPITLDLTRVEELFQAPAANPFSAHEIEILGESGMDFLRKRYTRRWPKRRDALAVLIRLPSELQSGDIQAGDIAGGGQVEDRPADAGHARRHSTLL